MEKENKFKRVSNIPEKKTKALDELVKLINESRSFIIVSIRNLPAKQFQLIKKKLKDEALIKVVKKNLIIRAIDKIEKGVIKNFKKYLKEDQALMFSGLEVFELSAILSKNKSMARAKISQEVDEDIIIEPGPTELIPGPVISELGSLGIQFAIEDGKINIKKEKLILKKGEKVNEAQASIMGKLDMKPIAVGLEPVAAYDSKEEKIFEDIKIDAEAIVNDMKISAGKALGFAVKLVYVCKDTLSYLLGKAKAEEEKLSSLIKEEPKTEEKEEKTDNAPTQEATSDSNDSDINNEKPGEKHEKEGIKTTPEEIEAAKKAVEKTKVENDQQNKSKEEK